MASGDKGLLLTVPEAALALRVSRNLAYELVARGELPAVHLGRLIRIPRLALEEWIARQAGVPVEATLGLCFRRRCHPSAGKEGGNGYSQTW